MKNLDTGEYFLDETSKIGDHANNGLGTRISAVVDLFESRKKAASVADVHVDSLYRYMRGQQSPTLEVMSKLCSAKGISLDWLASGEGPMHRSEVARPNNVAEPSSQWPARLEQPVDTLARIISTVDQLVSDLGIKADANLKAQLVAGIYQNASEYGSIEPVIEKLRLTLGALHAKSA